MPAITIADRMTDDLESEMIQASLTSSPASIKIAGMSTAGMSVFAAPAKAKEAPTPQPQSLEALYARLDQTEPGSEESNRISEEILNAIG